MPHVGPRRRRRRRTSVCGISGRRCAFRASRLRTVRRCRPGRCAASGPWRGYAPLGRLYVRRMPWEEVGTTRSACSRAVAGDPYAGAYRNVPGAARSGLPTRSPSPARRYALRLRTAIRHSGRAGRSRDHERLQGRTCCIVPGGARQPGAAGNASCCRTGCRGALVDEARRGKRWIFRTGARLNALTFH